ncbi:MAG: hydroxyacylglutathione hydrolase [Bacteriovoracaceae bacterium]|nr:hydroxyacylglutathione hydrolase [Bacteriovoracaceae bacterium]
MALLKIDILPALTDNYIFLLVDDSSGKTATIDPSEAKPVLDFLKTKNIKIDFI